MNEMVVKTFANKASALAFIAAVNAALGYPFATSVYRPTKARTPAWGQGVDYAILRQHYQDSTWAVQIDDVIDDLHGEPGIDTITNRVDPADAHIWNVVWNPSAP